MQGKASSLLVSAVGLLGAALFSAALVAGLGGCVEDDLIFTIVPSTGAAPAGQLLPASVGPGEVHAVQDLRCIPGADPGLPDVTAPGRAAPCSPRHDRPVCRHVTFSECAAEAAASR